MRIVKALAVNKKKVNMQEKSPSNPFIDAIEWDEMEAFMKLRKAGLVAGVELVRSAAEHDEYVEDTERHDVDPTTQLFV